jgi:hypothetical protein
MGSTIAREVSRFSRDTASVGKACRASVSLFGKLRPKGKARIGVELLAQRYAAGLDLWTGLPLATATSEQRPHNED